MRCQRGHAALGGVHGFLFGGKRSKDGLAKKTKKKVNAS